MKGLIISIILATVMSASAQSTQDTTVNKTSTQKSKTTLTPREKRNNWGFSVSYSEQGLGLSGSYFAPVASDLDFRLEFLVSGVTDSREFDQVDIFGNTYTPNKVNRVFMIPLNIGIQKMLFKDEMEGDLRPIVAIGVSPTLVLTNPYDRGYFSAFGYTQTSFALGGFAGAGLEFRQGKSTSLSFSIRYYYLPVIGKEVQSLRNNPIKDLGGLSIMFGLNFLK